MRAQSLISMLTQATAQTQVAAQPVNGSGGTAEMAQRADKRLPRGSIVNILA